MSMSSSVRAVPVIASDGRVRAPKAVGSAGPGSCTLAVFQPEDGLRLKVD